MRRCRNWRRLAAGTLLVLAATGCATYSQKMSDLRPQLAAGDFDGALATVDEQTGGKDVLLSYLERGIVLHYARRFVESNEAFEAAERTADDLYTRSLSEGAISLFTNDQSLSYRARPFEMAMVPYYRALNYAYLGQPQEALIEGRKAGELLSRYVDATLSGLDDEGGDLARLRNDAFLQYFGGMLLDWGGETNNAFIAYRNAALAYQQNSALLALQIPPRLADDLMRTARALGFQSEVERLRTVCPDVFARWRPADAGVGEPMGELALFLERGFVPRKIEARLDLPILKSDDESSAEFATVLAHRAVVIRRTGRRYKYDRTISIALPELEPYRRPAGATRVVVAGRRVDASRAQDLAGLARVTFDAESWKILLKTVIRVLAKDTVVRETDSSVGRFVADLFTSATETADTRSWLTLPAEIELVRLRLPAGVHDLEVRLTGPGGEVVDAYTIEGVEIRADDWTFLNHRDFLVAR